MAELQHRHHRRSTNRSPRSHMTWQEAIAQIGPRKEKTWEDYMAELQHRHRKRSSKRSSKRSPQHMTWQEAIAQVGRKPVSTWEEAVAELRRRMQTPKRKRKVQQRLKQEREALIEESIAKQLRLAREMEQMRSPVQRQRQMQRILEARPAWWRGILHSKAVQLVDKYGRKVLALGAKAIIGKAVTSAIYASTGMPILSELGGGAVVEILEHVPVIVQDPVSGLKQTGYAIVGMMGAEGIKQGIKGAAAARGIGGITNKAVGIITGYVIGRRFKGYMEGIGPIETKGHKLSDRWVANQALLGALAPQGRIPSQRQQMSYIQKHKEELVQGTIFAALAAAIAGGAQMKTGIPLVPMAWRFALKSSYAKAVGTALTAGALSIPANHFIDFIKGHSTRLMEKAGLKDIHLFPKAVRERIQAKVLRECLFDLTLNDLVNDAIGLSGELGTQYAAGAVVESAAKWRNYRDVATNLGRIYKAANKRFTTYLNDMLQRGATTADPGELSTADMFKNVANGVARDLARADRDPDSFTPIEEWHRRRAEEDMKGREAMLDDLRRGQLEDVNAREYKRWQDARMARLAGRQAQRALPPDVRQRLETGRQAEIDASADYFRKTIADAIGEFKKTKVGGFVYGLPPKLRLQRGLLYQGAEWYGGTKILGALNKIPQVANAVRAAKEVIDTAHLGRKLAQIGSLFWVTTSGGPEVRLKEEDEYEPSLGPYVEADADFADFVHDLAEDDYLNIPSVSDLRDMVTTGALPADLAAEIRRFDNKYLTFDVARETAAILGYWPGTTWYQGVGDVAFGTGAFDSIRNAASTWTNWLKTVPPERRGFFPQPGAPQ